jgi:hypothetical protein
MGKGSKGSGCLPEEGLLVAGHPGTLGTTADQAVLMTSECVL